MTKQIAQRDIRAFIVDLLKKKGPLPDIADIGEFNYVTSGHIDSLGMMKFLLQIESKYDFEFGDKELEYEGIRTPNGMAAIVFRLLSHR